MVYIKHPRKLQTYGLGVIKRNAQLPTPSMAYVKWKILSFLRENKTDIILFLVKI